MARGLASASALQRMTPGGPGSEGQVPARGDAETRESTVSPRSSSSSEELRGSSGHDLEADCIRRIATGDRAAFELLFRTYYKRLYGYLFRMVKKADVAEELSSDVMLEVWKRAGGFRGESKVSTWILGIARFRAISWLRRFNPNLVDIEDAAAVSDSHELQDEVLVRAATRKAVRKALAKLAPQHREVMELTFYQGFSYPEIAAILACPVSTVKTRMFYARKELRALLTKEGTA